MTQVTPSFKIFGSVDGMNVCDISLIQDMRDRVDNLGNVIYRKDGQGNAIYKKKYNSNEYSLDKNGQYILLAEQESKGWKLKIEVTNDGWKNKRMIFIQNGELINLIRTINGFEKKANFARKTKNASIENQTTHSFFKYSMKVGDKWENYAFKVDINSGIKMSGLALLAYKAEFKRTMGLDFNENNLLDLIKVGPSIFNNQSTNIQTEIIKPQVQANTGNNTGTVVDKTICAECGHQLDAVKEAKVIDFSNKKYGKTVCFKCQKKQ